MAESSEEQISYNNTNGDINNVILQLPMKIIKVNLWNHSPTELRQVEKIEIHNDIIIIYNVVSINNPKPVIWMIKT